MFVNRSDDVLVRQKFTIVHSCGPEIKELKIKQGDCDDAQEITAFIENHCQTNISKWRCGKNFITFFIN